MEMTQFHDVIAFSSIKREKFMKDIEPREGYDFLQVITVVRLFIHSKQASFHARNNPLFSPCSYIFYGNTEIKQTDIVT